MKILETPIQDLLIIEMPVFGDDRGFFTETYNADTFTSGGVTLQFRQDNLSYSAGKGTLRGMHLQKDPHAQAKLITVLKGKVMDVAVDLRPDSTTFGKHFGLEIEGGSGKFLMIPEGFAHGFQTLEDHTYFLYKCSNTYHKPSEVTLAWNDPGMGIQWPFPDPILSEKDTKGISLEAFTQELKHC